MKAKSRIVLTSPAGLSHTLKAFESIKINESENDPVKTASVEAPFIDNKHILEHHSINSTIQVFATIQEQKEQLMFYGYLTGVPKVLDGNVKKYSFEAQDVLGKTKTILINETFDNMTPQEIMRYLLNGYTDFFVETRINIRGNRVDLNFKDEYLYDCFKKIAEITNTVFWTELNTFHMEEAESVMNPTPIRRNMFEKGTGKFTDDSTQMVNHIRLYGDKELTPNRRTEQFNPNGTNRVFYTTYQPSNVEVYRDGAKMRVGTLNLHDDNSRYDVYLDYNNSLVEFVEPPRRGQLVEISYQYYQRIVLEEADQNSIEQYGFYMKTENVEHIADRDTLRQLAREKIKQNNAPKKVGTLKVFQNKWNAKERVLVDIPEIGVSDVLTVANKSITIKPNWLDIDLNFEQKPDLSTILKNHLNRIRELEKKREENIVVDKFRTITELIEIKGTVKLERLDRANTFKIGISKIGGVL